MMEPSRLYRVVEAYVDVPFNTYLSVILILTYACAIHSPRLLLAVVLLVSTVIVMFDKTSTTGEMTKTMCLLPFGLGSVLAFLNTTRPCKSRFLPAFTLYINFAVYANIGMMIFTPSRGALIRGSCVKVACIALFLWLVQQGRRVGWRTVALHDNLFYFRAVSKSWILAHAVYRYVLLTLPNFGSGRRHRLLELYSLTMTFALSKTFNVPFEHCFGMADTLVAPAEAGWSAIATMYDLIPRDMKVESPQSHRPGPFADCCLSVSALAVAVFASANVIRDFQRAFPKPE